MSKLELTYEELIHLKVLIDWKDVMSYCLRCDIYNDNCKHYISIGKKINEALKNEPHELYT